MSSKNFAAQLLLTASLLGVGLTAPNMAEAAGLAVNANQGTLNTAVELDFIDINAQIAGDLNINFDMPDTTLSLIAVNMNDVAAEITGNLNIASGVTVSASQTGILVAGGGLIGGSITNNGALNVGNLSVGVDSFGVVITGATQFDFQNLGAVNVSDASVNDGGAVGISVQAASMGSGLVRVNNQGDLVIKANELGNVAANANVTGVDLSGTFFGNATASFTNSDDFTALARASGSTNVDATIDMGIRLFASATGAGGNALASLTNSDDLSITAGAEAYAGLGADANAYAEVADGISQSAVGMANAIVNLANSGNLRIEANAYAGASSGMATASAYMDTAVRQIANGLDASVSLANTAGSIDLGASAQAYGSTSANATAKISSALFQSAQGNNTATVSLTNSADFEILAEAVATASNGYANAYASMNSELIEQIADASDTPAGSHSLASVSLINTGNLNIEGNAYARGTTADATASYSYEAISQSADGAITASALIQNNANLTISAEALAEGENVFAKAIFTTTVINQSASGNANGLWATADLTNSGNFRISAEATAVGVSSMSQASVATASAIFETNAFEQEADNASNVAARLANTGDFNIQAYAKATANALNGFASANATYSSYIISQVANADYDEISALAEITNSSNFGIYATASATAGRTASASAIFGSYVIQQDVDDGASSIARIANSGNFDIQATARARADYGNATAEANAYASLSAAISQAAEADGDRNIATAEIVNSGNFNIAILAEATGLSANATASFVYTIIGQSASGGADSLASIRNDAGNMNIYADARAHGEHAVANAVLTSYIGISQFASAGGDRISATAELTNNGNFYFAVEARAGSVFTSLGNTTVSANYAEANATMSSTAFYQSAANASTVTARVANTGDFDIQAFASATAPSGQAVAYAEFGTALISQNADAANDRLTATAIVENSGNMFLQARAKAIGSGSATATATLGSYGIYQQASGADVSRAIVQNSGLLEINARAEAYADVAKVKAFIATGIYQSATAAGGNTTASAELVNSAGNLRIVAGANAGTFTSYAGTSASAVASIQTGIYQSASSAINNRASINNSANLDIVAWADAFAERTAQAYAYITSYGIYQSANGNNLAGALAEVDLTNAGNLNIRAEATASATSSGNATAAATVSIGIYQSADDATTSIGRLTNSSDLQITAFAKADSDSSAAKANATIAVGISQNAFGSSVASLGTAAAELANSGYLAVRAEAIADASDNANAFASISNGLYQEADADGGPSATALLTNTGDLDLKASARADSTDSSANATASFGTGISQNAFDADVALASLVNSAGNINIAAEATASADDRAAAMANLETGIWQKAAADGGSSATASLTNSANLNIRVAAFAEGSDADATAQIATTLSLTSGGIVQIVDDAAAMLASVNNSGNLDITALALAIGSDSADANATANQGILQRLVVNGATTTVDPTAVAELVNSGNMNFRAEAIAGAGFSTTSSGGYAVNASVSSDATATAHMGGIRQQVAGGIARLTNTSEIIVSAHASASASGTAKANAFATGLFVEGNSSAAVGLDYDNQGLIAAEAIAEANGSTESAYAGATGILVNSDIVSGMLTNSGSVYAIAQAEGSNDTAEAIGILLKADTFNANLVNTGTIIAFASASNGGGTATAIRVGTHAAPGGVGTGSITNDGGLIVAIQDFNGMSPSLGNAINVEPAPHAITINLMGTTQDGNIIGHIDLSVDDTINVTSGKTLLTGEINPDGTNEGTLNINSNGELWLKLDDDFGETISDVANLNVASDGTLAIGVNALGDSNSMISTNANLDGTLLIDTNAGIYGNGPLHYEDVVAITNVPTGDFATVAANSPLFTVSYTIDDDVGGLIDYDIDLTRVAFNAAAGLTPNQNSVATMLEGLYNPGNGGIDELVTDDPAAVTGLEALMAELFSLNPEEYQAALDDLSGAEHGVVGQQYMRSFGVLDGIIGDVLRNRGTFVQQAALRTGESADGPYINPTAASAALIDPSKGGFWTRAQGSFASGDEGNSPAFDAAQGSIYFGADANLDGNTVLGALAGYVNGKQDFADSDSANYDGFQVGLYGQHDWEATYFRALAVYGSADVSVDRSGTIGILSGASAANYDANAWHVSGEVGHQWMMSGNSAITPFVGLAYSSYDSENFVETGTPGASLEANVDGDSLLGNIGLRLTSEVDTAHGIIRPEFMLAWEHEFLDFSGVNASISGVSGSTFAVTGGDETSNLAVIGAGLGFDFSESVSMKLNYTGRLGNDYQDHTMFGQLRMEF